MVSARSFVVGVVVLYKLWCVLRQRIDHTACQRIGSVFVILGALRIQRLPLFKACLLGILCVKIAVGGHTGHVVHSHGGGRLDARVDGRGVDRHTAPAADADDADTRRGNVILHRQKIHRCAEILGIDVGRSNISGCTTALAGIGRVKGNRQKTQLRHLLRVQPGGLLLYRAKRAADCDGGQLALCAPRCVQIRCQRDAVAVVKGHLSMIDLIAFGKHLVPFLCQMQLFHVQISFPA